MLVGLQVIRRFSENQGNSATIIFYVALFILTLPTIALLVVLGIIESFYPIKRTDS
jgi:Na+/melibiose symporter-like transporter